MKLICEDEKCIGCRSCENICPKSAIHMKRNEKGFLRPTIQQDSCIDCGLCQRVCNYSVSNQKKINAEKNITFKIYGVKNRDEDIRKKSSSGGIFYLLAKYILENRGVVYGCILDKNIEAVFSRAENLDEIMPMMGSKYVCSDLKVAFTSIAEDLKLGRKVLFTGTPCQCWQLKNFLVVKRISSNNLIMSEFLCHGAPSPVIFSEYKKCVETRYKGKIIKFNFRDKERVRSLPSCRGMRSKVLIHNEIVIDVYDEILNDRYFELFKRNYISNDACYDCKFVGFENRAADITLADFWGCERNYPDFFDKKGVSLVLVNTEKGRVVFDGIKNEIEYINVERQKCIQAPLKSAPLKPTNYDLFWNVFFIDGYMTANRRIVNKYLIQKKYYDFRKNVKDLLVKYGFIK